MEARILRVCCAAAVVLFLGASYRTQNFIVEAPTPQLAKEIGDSAERFRTELAQEWLGYELKPWRHPCPIRADVDPRLGAGGATSFMFRGRGPTGWRMTIQGSRERVLDSVLPHEVTHTIFATHFKQPLPRWADEGACTTVEHVTEKLKQEHLLTQFLTTGRGIAFNRMFAMTEYPADIMPLYSQGYALAQFLIAQGGKRRFVQYVGAGLESRDWPAATRNHYGFKDLSELQLTWMRWVRGGRPTEPQKIAAYSGRNNSPADVQLASARAAVEPIAAKTVEPAPTATLASTSGQPGWYASRPGEESAASRKSEPIEETGTASSAPVTYTPGSTARGASGGVTLTRPQPVGRPRQTVLDWEKHRPASAGQTVELSELSRPRTRLAPVQRY